MPKSKSDFTNFVDARPNYFPGQFLLEDDFEIQHKYLADRLYYQNRSLHVSGIIEGLEVEVFKETREVQIKSGSAINSNGDLIILKNDTYFSEFASLTIGELYISYKEEKRLKQQESIEESFTRWQELPTIGFAATTPDDAVKLAIVFITDSNPGLDLTVRSYSGIFLPNSTGNDLTLRSGGNDNPNVAILNGSLTVTGTITGNIDAVNINSENLTVINVLKIGQDATGGTRDWMTRGMSVGWDSDNLFIGLKNEGSNRKDAVIAWGDDPQDDLRFINVPAGGAANGTEVIRVKSSGNVGIGTTTPSEKLEVSGNLKVTGTITTDNKITVLGTQQILFTNSDTSNNLKLQLWSGYGLGINGGTLFYTAGGKHSWRDNNGNERMMLTTGPDGSLTVNGTGTSSFAGNLTVTGRITTEPWQTPSLQNSWARYDDTYNPPGYFKDSFGIVHLRGLVRGGTATIFTLPVGYRPAFRELQAVQTHDNVIGRLDILTSGQVWMIKGNNLWFSLDGVTFRAAQ